MAQYYTKRPKSLFGKAQPSSSQQQAPKAAQDLEDNLNASFYIFPSPSESSFPSSPHSGFSETLPSTEIPLSPCLEILSITGSAFSTPIVLTPVDGREKGWEWLKEAEDNLCSPPARPQSSRKYFWVPRVAKKPLESGSGLPDVAVRGDAFAKTNNSSTSVPGKGAGPHPEATYATFRESVASESPPKSSSHVPFLSFFASLLSTDRSTHDMISTSSIPSLFQSTTASPRSIEAELQGTQGGTTTVLDSHGIGKFVVSMSEEAPLFRGPMKSGGDISVIPFNFHLSDVLQMVTGIGGQLLYVVFRV